MGATSSATRIFHEPFKRFLIPVRRYIKISRKTLLSFSLSLEREDPDFQRVHEFRNGKRGHGGSRGRRGVAALTVFHRFEQPPTGVGAKGLRENSSSRRQRGSYLEFLKSHLPVLCNVPRFFSPLAPFHPRATLSREDSSLEISLLAVYSDIFSFFSSFTDKYILSVAGRRVQQNVSDE